jgi:hypothetical protein
MKPAKNSQEEIRLTDKIIIEKPAQKGLSTTPRRDQNRIIKLREKRTALFKRKENLLFYLFE